MNALPLINNGFVQLLMTGLLLLLFVRFAVASLRFWQRNRVGQGDLIDNINELLPQTQCGQCGFEGCLPYARAIAGGTATNQCPPGGELTIIRLANLLNEIPQPLNPAHGKFEPAKVAVIREEECIGCTKCIRACPVDAILGGAKLMHTVIENECTGCDLCLAPCPVDCIDMVIRPAIEAWRWRLPTHLHGAEPMQKANPA